MQWKYLYNCYPYLLARVIYMKIKVRKSNTDGNVRLETSGSIKEIMINEDFFNPNNESIVLGFRGKNSSGLVELSTQEIDFLYKEIQKNKHLIKSIKVFKVFKK